MQIQENVLLAPYTTFKIGGPAKYFCVVENQFDALEAYEFARKNNLKTFVLGGGSNILVNDEGFNGLVIRIVNKGIEVLETNSDYILLKVASGEIWDEVVKFAVKNNWWGIENLSHIPGSTGAIAVQNVGAYGQEASRVIEYVTVFNTRTHQILNLTNAECLFGYRKSIFNYEKKGEFIIFNIVFKLHTLPKPVLSYKDLTTIFASTKPTIEEIRNAVIKIRDKKFPFPTTAIKGNAGSFFKNPIITLEKYSQVKNLILQHFGIDKLKKLEEKKFEYNNNVKLPAAYLIDICSLKNLSVGGASINENQPLVIVNQTGEANSKDVLTLANKVKISVLDKTGIDLKFEPELIGFY